MQPSDVNLVPITKKTREDATVRDICRRLISNGEISDPYEFQGKRVDTVSGDCLKLDMRNEADRETYADLVASAVAHPDDVVIIWEERVKVDDGGLIIYLCCVKSMKIATGSLK